MRLFARIILGISLAVSFGTAAVAGSIEVSPTLLEAAAPAGASALTLTNRGATPLRAQVRVFRWTQENGEDQLSPTSNVVASPPSLVLNPRQPYTLRIVRTDREPAAEEAYRVLIDEIPELAVGNRNRVSIVLRLNIPAFFSPANVQAPSLSFSVQGRELVVSNTGGRHVRLSDVVLRDGSGKSASLGKGLLGYVLPGATKSFLLNAAAQRLPRGSLSVSAMTETGPVNARLGTRN